ncbi:glycoside hydrolase/phage tail family protein [Octadecabacter sp. CECT 8868]|uniref:baseplate multidomain protein megatron n=1 Tax=Octadecabacter algicola TaxID=2909342 RepID=UPI001F283270|nr:glycoside hydrolase TIM-barrel-like domain-containing protein [Octadecabacter algicola]MCF2903548.1 glycoside hydrolase/phage tail family protein [Octadecabacter algicola]
MATIVLSAAGMALGGSVGGTVLGLGMGAIGRAAGASLGSLIDQRILGGGADAVETGRVDRFRLTGASEGAAMNHVYGRMRIAGQVIWATQFVESSVTSGGGKGGRSRAATKTYSYSVSLAIALCEGEISRVGRIWADGEEIARDDLNMRIYTGSEDQLPDPKMEAVEGAGLVPAYRGTAYVVLEDLDLGQFSNRVPQFSFEVMRPGPGDADIHDDMNELVTGVALVPGTGEYALATTPVTLSKGFGVRESTNVNTPAGKTDYLVSMEALEEELPNCGSVTMVVSWFGNDLRCGDCQVIPKVEQTETDGNEMAWAVSGVSREGADVVPSDAGRPVYGGTPADAAVLEALKDMAERGKRAVFYPFILMEQQAGNTLLDPWTGEEGQPSLPWRGRITTSLAPTVNGTPDQTAVADAEVAAFFGQAVATDFTVSGETIVYSGPAEWSYRRFILHYAHLCALAGDVDAFCIGSEMRSLTQIRGANGFPAVKAMIDLAGDVREILGPDVKIGYASDWSEYHGYQPSGTADKLFHLDPLWACEDIDFIGIDNYMPLSDWREGDGHLDAEFESIYNLEYLRGNVEGGEGYDWYYHSPEAMAAQIRTPITDGDGEPWVWRYKDLRNWWLNAHHERVDGVRATLPTVWAPGSKPIWFTEIGCAAVDKATNEPNKFVDPKSSESALPRASNGIRDDYIQLQYLRAIYGHYNDPDLNPVSDVTGVRMVDTDRIHVWAWDARPFPAFPGNGALWSDNVNYSRGHWINGRASTRPLSSVVAEICERAGVTDIDVTALHGIVRGYCVDDVTTARSALQPLMMAYGFDAIERDGVLVFRTRGARLDAEVSEDQLVYEYDAEGAIELTRAQEPEIAGRVRVGFVESDADYEVRTSEAVFPDDRSLTTSASELPLVLTSAEGQRIAERWLLEARVARDTARLTLPPSLMHVGAGDVISLPDGHGDGLFRVDQSEQTDRQALDVVRIEPAVYEPQDVPERTFNLRSFVPPVPVELMLMDLPLLSGDEDPVAPYVATSGVPWPGSVALYSATQDAGYDVNRLVTSSSVMGVTQTVMNHAPTGRYDRGPALQVQLIRGDLQSVSTDQILGGANVAVIGDGSANNWEVFQFAEANIIDENTYEITMRLRGQAGSDGIAPDEWPVGSIVLLLNGAPEQISLASSARGVEQHFRYGPGARPLSDPSYQYRTETFSGNGLRPYRVAHLRKQENGADLGVTWVRRTRKDGDSWDSEDVPLSEAFERYAVRVFKDGVQMREVSVSDPSWTYTSAMQTADGTGEIRIDVAQVSDVYGEGPVATTTFST